MKKMTLKMIALGILVLGVVATVGGCMMAGRGRGVSPEPQANPITTEATVTSGQQDEATQNGAVQKITGKMTSYSYPDITVQKGKPVELTLQADSKDLNGCNNAVVSRDFGFESKLEAGDNVITFTPKETGVYNYSCWMGMITATITVVDGEVDPAAAVVEQGTNDPAVINGQAARSGDSAQCPMINNQDEDQDYGAGRGGAVGRGCCG